MAGFLVTGLLGTGCGDPRRDEEESLSTSVGNDDDDDDDNATSGASTGGADDDDDDDDDDTSDGGTKLDVAPDGLDDDAGDVGDEDGCDKVDFLFVIDHSGSMGDEQDNLKNSFPLFIDTISTELDEAQDYHIMVVDVDAYVFEMCESGCQCTNDMGMCDPMVGPGCDFACLTSFPCAFEADYTCGVTTPMECEDVLGAGVTYPRGASASNMDCNFSSGARYMDSTEPDLTAAFSCAAGLGTSSYAATERPMEAMVNAVSPNTPAAACNEGFIRDDAILVVTFITDENDSTGDSAGTVAGWRQALIAAKGGDETAVVVLGLFGDNDQPGGICQDLADSNGAEAAPRLREFVDSWGDRGFYGSVCASDYDDFFTEAVGIIDTTCEEFQPPEG